MRAFEEESSPGVFKLMLANANVLKKGLKSVLPEVISFGAPVVGFSYAMPCRFIFQVVGDLFHTVIKVIVRDVLGARDIKIEEFLIVGAEH